MPQRELEAKTQTNLIIHRQPADEREEEEEESPIQRMQSQFGNRAVGQMLNRKAHGNAEVSPEVENAIQRARGGGQALDSKIRTSMERAFGANFGGVRVHTDAEADALNRAVSARAFTTGQDIFFKQGEYSPSNSSGRELLAHELTHVVQQGAARRISPQGIVGFDGMKSTSKVRAYLQALTNGDCHEPSVYAQEIAQFQRENTSDQIASLQRQILEKPRDADIRQKSDSQTLTTCAGCGALSGSTSSTGAVPTNFRQTYGSDAGGGVLHFAYAWDSSTGNLADLRKCKVGEKVYYTQTENPPFKTPKTNPAVRDIEATEGRAMDNHYPTNVKPYKESTQKATQYYWFKCGENAFIFMRSTDIVRQITKKPDGNYKYRITKTGVSASGASAEIDPLP